MVMSRWSRRSRAGALRIAILVCIVALSLPQLHAQILFKRTSDLRMIYLDQKHSYLVPYTVRCFENSLSFHRKLFDYQPDEEVTVLLHDFNDYGSGGTNTIPWNYLSIGIEPYDYVYETSPTNERMNWVMNHELVHLLGTDKANGSDRFFRSLFDGKVTPTSDNPLTMLYSYLTTPRWYSPRWYHEGVAVFMETWMAGGIGRALGGYDEMVFRTMVRDSSYFYDYVGLESEGTTIDFQIGANSYLYGTRFVSYLAYHYGPEKLLQWFNRTPDSKQYYATQFENVYGVTLGDEWSKWIDWEHSWQHANLDSVNQYPVTVYRPLLHSSLGSVSRAFFDSTRGQLYVALNLPGQLAHIASIDVRSGEIRRLCDVTGPALYYVSSTAFDPVAGTLFFTIHNSSSYRGINAVDVTTGKTRVLLSAARTGDLAFNRADRSLWGIEHNDGLSTLVRVPFPYDAKEHILPLKYGKDLFDVDISPDGRALTASLIEINGRQRLVRMWVDSLLAGNYSYDVLYEFKDNSPQNFVFTPDGRFLYGTTYVTGVSNIFRYDFERGEMKCVTNTETGLFRPLPVAHDSLIAFRYTGTGFLPVILGDTTREDVSAINYLGQGIVDRYPIVVSWKLPPPSIMNPDSLIIESGDYSAWSLMKPASVYPIVEGYKVYTSIGLRTEIQDPLLSHALNLTASYAPQRGLPAGERFHAGAELTAWQWKFNAAYNGADFYDLFGPTRTSRKGYAAGARYTDFLIYDRPRTLEYSLSLNGYTGLERQPEYQNIPTSFERFATAGGRISYSNVKRSLGAVDAEEGPALSLNNLTTVVLKSVFSRFHTTLDYGFLLPIDHSSIWLRTAVGYSIGDRASSFAYFYFGGFGNNIIDNGEVKRYRTYYSFPGIDLNGIGGTDFFRGMLEWTLPPIRFRQFGLPSFYCTWARLALFTSAITTDISHASDRTGAWDVGAQIDFNLVLFSHLESMLSFGYAAALERNERMTREFMVSLKLQ